MTFNEKIIVITEFISWLGYTFLLAKYFYMAGWNSAMDEVQKAMRDSNSKGEPL